MVPEIGALALAPEDGQPVFTTGLVIQELLQGFGGPKGREQILERLSHCL